MPRASIILPIYESQITIKRALECLTAQSYPDFEIICIDSSFSDHCEQIIRQRFPDVIYDRSAERLWPHDANNRGAIRASGEVFVFIDPDAYARRDWLKNLLQSYDATGGPVAGSVACYGRKWIDLGAHFCKFDRWLPRKVNDALDVGPTVNLLIPRTHFERLGPFPGRRRHGDTEMCWRMRAAGVEIAFEPNAIVEHHHMHTWRSLLRERYDRGRGFGRLVGVSTQMPPASPARLVATILPLRLASQLWRVWGNAYEAGLGPEYLRTLPVVISGLYAWLLGEGQTYAEQLFSKTE